MKAIVSLALGLLSLSLIAGTSYICRETTVDNAETWSLTFNEDSILLKGNVTLINPNVQSKILLTRVTNTSNRPMPFGTYEGTLLYNEYSTLGLSLSGIDVVSSKPGETVLTGFISKKNEYQVEGISGAISCTGKPLNIKF